MKWTKIKNIILWFLLSMNIFMIAVIAITTHNRESVPQEVVDASVSVLTKSGFSIGKETFPDTYHMLPDYSTKFYSASELSNLFFKKQAAFRTTGNSLVATVGSETLTINGNHFVYDNGRQEAETASHSAIRKKLESIGIDMKGAVYDDKENCFYRMYNKANLFNMSIQAKLDKDGNLCYVNGYWPKELTAGERKKFSFLESAVKLKDYFPDGGNIEDIELGFSLVSSGGEKYIFTPAWRVKVNGELKIIE